MPKGVYLRKKPSNKKANRHEAREVFPEVNETKPDGRLTDERNQLRAEVRRLERLVIQMAEKLL